MKKILLCCGFLIHSLAFASERILNFEADLQIAADASMVVTETLRVQSEAVTIKHGIFRDIPTRYRDTNQFTVKVDFELLGVTLDDRSVLYHTEKLNNGLRIYIGDAGRSLPAGVYVYQLRYKVRRHLGFFSDHDELYWNVTGNGWQWSIDKVSALVHLPAGVPSQQIHLEGYTGFSGEQGQDYLARLDVQDRGYFQTTRMLRPQEGLTIVVTWPKSYVAAPTLGEQRQAWLADNMLLLIFAGSLLLVGVYYAVTWWFFGKDPRAGVVVPRYDPPATYSPAALRFVSRMGYDVKTFASLIIFLAVKGYLRIEENAGGDFKFYRLHEDVSAASEEERVVFNKLFEQAPTCDVRSAGYARMQPVLNAHKSWLRKQYQPSHFKTHRLLASVGVILSVFSCVTFLKVLIDESIDAVVLTVIAGIFLSILLHILIVQASKFQSRPLIQKAVLVIVLLVVGSQLMIAAPHFIAGLVDGGFVSLPGVALMLFLYGLNVAMIAWLKAPTVLGRRLLDDMEGFKLYLELAEKDELRARAAKMPDLFSVFFPYALALGVEQQWCERFAAAFAGQELHEPDWYRTQRWDHSRFDRSFAQQFSTSLGAGLSRSVAAATVPPSSSSGSGGRGSSGGGGGGGGGGGW